MRVLARAAAVITLVIGAIIAGGVAGGSATAATSCQPAIRDLGEPYGGDFSIAVGVNSSGAVAGSASLPDGHGRATVWQDGHATNLGTVAGYSDSFAHDISDDGTVVGVLIPAGPSAPRAFFYTGGRMRLLPTLGGDFTFAAAINRRDVVVGTASDRAGNSHAVVWSDNGRRIHDLGIARGDVASFGSGINNANTAVGDTDRANGTARAAIFEHRRVVVLAGLGGPVSQAVDINDAGQVVGFSDVAGGAESHATIWEPFQSRPRDLGTLPGGTFAALGDIDNRGRAGGVGQLGDQGHAVVWPGHGPLLALQPLSRRFYRDFGTVNKLGRHGEAVGGSEIRPGQLRATVWTCAFAQAFRPHSASPADSSSAAFSLPSGSSKQLARDPWSVPIGRR